MNHDKNSPDVQDQLPACERCHASKVRCRRAPGEVRCRRCTRAAYSDCHPRPSRRGGRVGQQQARRGSSGPPSTPKPMEEDTLSLPATAVSSNNMTTDTTHDLHQQQTHDMNTDTSNALLDLISVSMAPSGDGLSDPSWEPLVHDVGPDSMRAVTLPTSLAPTLSNPSASSHSMRPGLSETLQDGVTSTSGLSTMHKIRGSGSESRSPELSRLPSASYMQALMDLHAQMLSQQDSLLQFLAAPMRYTHVRPTGEISRRASSSSDTTFAAFPEGPVEAALRLGLALRSLLHPNQTCERDMPTALFLISTVLRLASLLHDLLGRLQGMLAQVTNKNALCAFVFPPVRLGSLLLKEQNDDRLRPLQMHSISMALGAAEGLIDEVIQLTERALPENIADASGTMEDGEGNTKDEFGLQALTQALVAKQEAVVESISGLRDMLCC
ncbi:hypothetical protein B0J15DRAFT_198525 [Fusarium solani]|uniref:Zn(2)-C6 fungal-type domain-containing protein n=1 Tax=Fusarium solani TaxID=169388 RepID=A0A9P9JMT1_FUSSL|nr:uncharacterized protein B0J15DRAFT_198525 [Fusarium solani]KAH7230787.1 hypothetical protein B0J15DRAFT_198525 [Fusarium solani]